MQGAQFHELATFLAVARCRSFREASKRLGMTPSSTSRAVARLETRLGVRLLNRTTRSVSCTAAGEALCSRASPLIEELDSATADIAGQSAAPSGVLKLNLPRIAADLLLLPLLPSFEITYPHIRLELTIDDDLSDVTGEGFDAGIRIGARLPQDMIALPMGPELRNAIVGSPAYFSQRPPPKLPSDLRNHQCLNYRWSTTGQVYRWPFRVDGRNQTINVDSQIQINDTDLLLKLAIQGLGLACLPDKYVASTNENGMLIRVLEAFCEPFPGFYLYHTSRKRTPSNLQILIEFLQSSTTKRLISVL